MTVDYSQAQVSSAPIQEYQKPGDIQRFKHFALDLLFYVW